MNIKNSYSHWPDEKGYFGQFGGRYVAESLMPLIIELEKAYSDALNDPNFRKEIKKIKYILFFSYTFGFYK